MLTNRDVVGMHDWMVNEFFFTLFDDKTGRNFTFFENVHSTAER